MADYIRRRKVEFELCGGNLPEKYKAFVRRVLNDKNLVPAADVAEVVYCKDCKYGDYDSKSNGAMVCLRTNDGFWRKETDFCSYGEYQTNTGSVTE